MPKEAWALKQKFTPSISSLPGTTDGKPMLYNNTQENIHGSNDYKKDLEDIRLEIRQIHEAIRKVQTENEKVFHCSEFIKINIDKI